MGAECRAPWEDDDEENEDDESEDEEEVPPPKKPKKDKPKKDKGKVKSKPMPEARGRGRGRKKKERKELTAKDKKELKKAFNEYENADAQGQKLAEQLESVKVTKTAAATTILEIGGDGTIFTRNGRAVKARRHGHGVVSITEVTPPQAEIQVY